MRPIFEPLESRVLMNAGPLDFSDTGVWDGGVRVYEDSIEVFPPLDPSEQYTFKSRIINSGDVLSSATLNGYIEGPENFSWTHGEITLDAGSSSIRQHTEIFSKPGDYRVSFDLDNGNYVSMSFNVTPEPSSLILFASAVVGIVAPNKQRR